jgi:SRSO17 transposase
LRRNIDDPSEYAYYLAYRPKETPVDELIQLAGRRWQLEDSFEATKGEVCLDEYEVRKWEGWYRHITLCLSAHAKPVRFDTYCNCTATGLVQASTLRTLEFF